ncbi:MAG: 3-oxoacyl-ACP synthase III [Planctomycetota bacterium]
MRFRSVHLASLAHALPEEVVTSDALEARLWPLYERLGVSVGRLELMSGIKERRFWPPGTRPSHAATVAGELALERAGVSRDQIGLLIFTGVCRDFMEPATASVVHAKLGLSPTCPAFDVSNACLGFLNGMALAAEMIERGSLETALIVSGEDGRPLIDETIRALTAGHEVGRRELKLAYASLTIGSGAAAAVLTSARRAPHGPRIVGGAVLAATEHHELCSGDRIENGGPLMQTDSEALLHAGNALAAETWGAFLKEVEWRAEDVERIVTHQVGVQHKKLLFDTLGLDHARDFPTVAEYGNIGSVSLPLSLSLAREAGFVRDGQRVALMGIGSGLHCMMLALE